MCDKYTRTFATGGLIKLHYSAENHAFIADLETNTNTSEQNAVYDQLRRDGYDPYLFTVR